MEVRSLGYSRFFGFRYRFSFGVEGISVLRSSERIGVDGRSEIWGVGEAGRREKGGRENFY